MEPHDYSQPPRPVAIEKRKMPRVIVALLVLLGITCLAILVIGSCAYYRVRSNMDQLYRDLGGSPKRDSQGED